MKNLRRLFFALFLGCFVPVLAYAQGIFIPPRVVTGTVNGITRPIPGATVTVCAANTAGIPCSPALANAVFKDSALTVPLSNPFTTDANGNYPQAALAGGVYTITESAAGFTGFSYQVTVSCAPGAPCTVGLFVASSATITGAIVSCSYNGMFVAGSSCTPTLAAAATAACALSPVGGIYVPGTYAGTDIMTNNCNAAILDMRNKGAAEMGFWSQLAPIRNTCTLGGTICYKLGSDARFIANGPADLYIAHNTNVNAATTTAATLSVGVNSNVLVGSTSNFSNNGAGFAPGLIVGRGTANEETLASANYTIVDPTHFNLTCAKTHSGTTDIEEFGSTIIQSKDLILDPFAVKPSQQTTAQLQIKDHAGDILVYVPTNITDTWPTGGWQWQATQTGKQGANSDEVHKMATASSHVLIQDPTGATNLMFLNATGDLLINAVSGSGASVRAIGTTPFLDINDTSGGGHEYRLASQSNQLLITDQTVPVNVSIYGPVAGWQFLKPIGSAGTAAGLTGTGACATITTQVGGSWAGSAKCTGTTGASTLTITFAVTAPNGWNCFVQDETTRANVFQQTSHTTTTCVLTVTSVTQNDVFVFSGVSF